MKRARDGDDVGWHGPGSEKKLRLFSDFEDYSFTRPLPVRTNSEPFPSSFAYRPAANTGVSDGSTDGSPDSVGSPVDMPDIDMDDDDFSIVGSNSPPTPPPPSQNRPAKLVPSPYQGSASIQSRIPTPTSNSFLHAGPSPLRQDAFAQHPDTNNTIRLHSPMAPPPSRRFAQARDYPMPSPIRESLYSPSRPLPSPSFSPRSTSMPSPGLQSPAAAAHDMSRLSVNGDGMDVEDRPPMGAEGEQELESPTAVRMGRQRSGAMFSEKKRYHLGYLDDCEKCRARVPGHHSHFLPVDG